MKVELEGSHRKALLKGCLWMGSGDGGSEGGQDEASQQRRLQHQRYHIAKTCDEGVPSKFNYL